MASNHLMRSSSESSSIRTVCKRVEIIDFVGQELKRWFLLVESMILCFIQSCNRQIRMENNDMDLNKSNYLDSSVYWLITRPVLHIILMELH